MDRNTFFDNLKNYNANSLHNNITNKHASNRFEFYDSLQHHGIKGQKWGIRRYQNPDGSLTEEGKQRYLNPDGSLNRQGQKELGREGVAKFNQQRQQQQNNNTGNVYDEETQKNKLNNAKQNKMYDKMFVETIQNADLSTDEINKEYEAYLKDPKKYSETFETDSLGKIKNSLSGNNTSKPKAEPKLKEEVQEGKGKSEYEREMNKILDEKGYLDANDVKSLSKYSTKVGNESTSNSSKSNKLTKEEKKEAKAAQKEVQKNLKGGLINNWALLNKAIEQAGITDTKNMSASDWNKVNDIIQDMRGSKKKSK